MTNIEEACRRQEMNLVRYFKQSEVPLHKIMCKVNRGQTALQLGSQEVAPIIITENDRLEEERKSKTLHGRFFRQLQQTEIYRTFSIGWLVKGSMFPETEGFLTAIQDPIIATRLEVTEQNRQVKAL